LGEVSVAHFYRNTEDLARVAINRGVPNVKMGMKVNIDGRIAVLIGADCNCNFELMDTEEFCIIHAHPTWETTYYSDDGSVIYEFKKAQRSEPLTERRNRR
jgi:hypothetical protein